MTELPTSHLANAEFNHGDTADNLNSDPFLLASSARARFFAEHGPAAEGPRRQGAPKELRKALLAAEMARWESF